MTFRTLSEDLYSRGRSVVLPDLQNSQYAYAAALRRELHQSARWLDLGCGHEHLPPWFSSADRRLDTADRIAVGIDLDEPALRRHRGLTLGTLGNIEQLPFATGTFDLVTANMVLEHVERPASLFAEIARVLGDGGRLLVHTPNLFGYSTLAATLLPQAVKLRLAKAWNERDAGDVYPTYYRANTRAALKTLAEDAGLAVKEIVLVLSSPLSATFAPLMIPELLLLRALSLPALGALRPCMVATFTKAAPR